MEPKQKAIEQKTLESNTSPYSETSCMESNAQRPEVESIPVLDEIESDKQTNKIVHQTECFQLSNEAEIKAIETIIDMENLMKVKNVKHKSFSGYDNYEQYKKLQPPIWPNNMWVMLAGSGQGSGRLEYDNTRNKFVLIVFSIVFAAFLLTIGFMLLVMNVEILYMVFISYGVYIAGACGLIMLGMNYVIMAACSRRFPMTLILLIIGVICMSCITAYVSIRYTTWIILLALIALAVVLLICSLLACTKFDFTSIWLYVVIVGVTVAIISLVIMIVMLVMKFYIPILALVLLIILTLVQVVMFIITIQMILGGRSIELEDDEYFLGAYLVYTSVISIFINLLQIIGIIDELL